MDKQDKQLENIVDKLIRSAISEVMEKLPDVVKDMVHAQLEQVYKKLNDIQDDQADIRKDLDGFDKRMSDIEILLGTIDGRTAQIKVTQDKGPKNMEKHVTNAVNDAVESSVPEAMMSVVEPKKKNFQPISKRSIFDRIRRR